MTETEQSIEHTSFNATVLFKELWDKLVGDGTADKKTQIECAMGILSGALNVAVAVEHNVFTGGHDEVRAYMHKILDDLFDRWDSKPAMSMMDRRNT
jgi:hypothetical protein